MATVNKSIEVDVPVSVAYNQWTQFESFPEFMNGVEAVRQIDDTALHFSTNVGGVKRDYNAQIIDQVPDSLVAGPAWTAPQRRLGDLRTARRRQDPRQRGNRVGTGHARRKGRVSRWSRQSARWRGPGQIQEVHRSPRARNRWLAWHHLRRGCR